MKRFLLSLLTVGALAAPASADGTYRVRTAGPRSAPAPYKSCGGDVLKRMLRTNHTVTVKDGKVLVDMVPYEDRLPGTQLPGWAYIAYESPEAGYAYIFKLYATEKKVIGWWAVLGYGDCIDMVRVDGERTDLPRPIRASRRLPVVRVR